MIEAVYLVILGNVYWTDHGSDLIEVSRVGTAYRAVIISEVLDQPRAIAVQPLEGCVVLVLSVTTLTFESLHHPRTILSISEQYTCGRVQKRLKKAFRLRRAGFNLPLIKLITTTPTLHCGLMHVKLRHRRSLKHLQIICILLFILESHRCECVRVNQCFHEHVL